MIQSDKLINPQMLVAAGLLVFVTVFGYSNVSEAKSNVVPVEGVSYSVASTLADNLKSMLGKKVTVTLESGKVMTGIVKALGKHLLHLEKLDGKEFYDALIRTDEISAIETRFRMIKR